jgi:hypothetical protein
MTKFSKYKQFLDSTRKEELIVKYFDYPARTVLFEKAPLKVRLKQTIYANEGFFQKENHFTGNFVILMEGSEYFVRKPNEKEWNEAKRGELLAKYLNNGDQSFTQRKKIFIVIDYSFDGSYNSIGAWLGEDEIEII